MSKFIKRTMFLHSYEHNSLTGDLRDLGKIEYDEHEFSSLREFQSIKMSRLIPNKESAAITSDGIVIYDTKLSPNNTRFIYRIYFK
jgi:hypothetical protein